MAKKAVLKTKKKETVKKPVLRGKVQSPRKKVTSPEAKEAHERAEWQKEKRGYWSSRFRRVLADIITKPKAKKTNAF